MVRLLHISSSPRGSRSESASVADAFLLAYREANPTHETDRIDLWNHDLPVFDDDVITAKYAMLRKLAHTPAQAAAWSRIEAEVARMLSYDKLVFSVPMWNWSIPFVLKQYIDVVTQPGLLFDWTKETGYVGRLNRPVVVVYSSSFDYTSQSPMFELDHQRTYFQQWLAIIGCLNVSTITVAPTAAPAEVLVAERTRAIDRAKELAVSF